MALLGFLPPNFPIYVQIVNYGSVSLAGWITFPGVVADAIMSALAGKILDKKGARLPIISGIIASLISLAILLLIPKLYNLEIVILFIIYYGGYGMSFSSLMTSGLMALNKKNHAQGTAIFNTLQQFSGAVGTALAGTLIAISQNVQSLRKPIATSIGARWTFIVLFILLICSLIIRLIFVPKYKDANKN